MQKYIWTSGQVTGNIDHFGAPYSAFIFPVNLTDTLTTPEYNFMDGSLDLPGIK